MKQIYSLFLLQVISAIALAAPIYKCDVQYVKRGTLDKVRTEQVSIDYQGFSKICVSGKCAKQDYIVGGKAGDQEIVALISHKEDGHGMSTMLMDFKLGQNGDYIQSSLAGTDFGNRLYTQVSTPNAQINLYINCVYVP